MKKLVVILVIVTVLVVATFFVQKSEKKAEISDKPVVKIGAILPLTGGMANLGSAGYNGAILAVEEANENPQSKYRYELVADDTATDAKRSVPIYKKMVGIDKVAAIVSFDSQAGHVLKTLTPRDKMMHISSAMDTTIADGKYNFVNSSDIYEAVEKLLKYFDENEYKRIAIASTNHIAAQKVIEVLEEKIKGYDLDIVGKELVNPTEQQIKPEVYNIVKSEPDVVFLYGFEPMTSLYAKELKNAGYSGAISSVYTLSYSEHPELLEGQIYLDYGSGSENFNNRFFERFGVEANPAGVVIFDSVSMIIEMYERGVETLDELLEDYSGPNGKLVMKDSGLIHADMVFVKMTSGKPVVVEQ